MDKQDPIFFLDSVEDELLSTNTILDEDGVLESPGRFIYVGELRDGKPNGPGIMTFVDGTTYEGRWKDGVLNGNVRCVFANGDEYVGLVENGKPNGRGTFTFASGGSYSGEWKNGHYHGKGVLVFPQGTKLVGIFENGHLCKTY